jgi:hypothetical protein
LYHVFRRQRACKQDFILEFFWAIFLGGFLDMF